MSIIIFSQGVCDVGRTMIDEGHHQSDEFQNLIDELMAKWADLNDAVAERKRRLELSEVAQQVST